jgi:hypothetical protein
MPNNFPNVGFVHLILPNARIIDARRDPLDTCVSCFKQLFAQGQTFTYDLLELGEYYLQYLRMMEHWDQVLPGRVLRVQYEDVVADLEGQARRMLAHCALEWEDDCLRFHETARAVRTASSEQVRRPIYRDSVGAWRHYERHLEPLITLGSAVAPGGHERRRCARIAARSGASAPQQLCRFAPSPILARQYLRNHRPRGSEWRGAMMPRRAWCLRETRSRSPSPACSRGMRWRRTPICWRK